MYDRARASRASHNAPSSLPSFLRLSGSTPPSALPDSVHLDLSDKLPLLVGVICQKPLVSLRGILRASAPYFARKRLAREL